MNNDFCLRLSSMPHASPPMLGAHFAELGLMKMRTRIKSCISTLLSMHVVVLTWRILQNRRTHVHSSLFKAREVILRRFSQLLSLSPSSKTNSSTASRRDSARVSMTNVEHHRTFMSTSNWTAGTLRHH